MTKYSLCKERTGRLANEHGWEPHPSTEIYSCTIWDGMQWQCALVAAGEGWECGDRDLRQDQIVRYGPVVGDAAGPADRRAEKWGKKWGIEFDWY